MINTARKSPKSSKVAEPTGALAEIANRSCQADPFATSRTDLQGLPEQDIVARGFDPEKLVVHRTSGSSGEPLSIRRTWFEDRLLQAHRLRILFRLGMRLTDRRVAVVTGRLTQSPIYMRSGVLRYEEIHCLWPSDRILARLRETRPDVLRGFPGTLSWLAGQLTDSDRELICTAPQK